VIHVKEGVSAAGVKPELIWALFQVERVFVAEGVPLVVTSIVRESTGVGNSLHPIGLAADLRIRSIVEEWPGGLWELEDVEATAERCRAAVAEAQFIVESDHIHMEVQP